MRNDQNSKILFVVSYAYPYHAGGGISALNFAEFLNTHGYQAKILTFNRNLKFSLKSVVKNTEIIRIPYFNNSIILKLLSLLIILPVYFIQITKANTTIIYGGYIIAWEFIAIFGWLFKNRIIFRSTMFGEDDAEALLRYNKLLRPLRKYALKRIDNYFSLTPSFTKSYILCFQNWKKVIESSQGVNTQIFSPVQGDKKLELRKKLGIPEKDVIIISVGIVINRKEYSRIFQELDLLKFPFKYIVLGDFAFDNDAHISLKDTTINRVYEKGRKILADRVIFKGYVENVSEYLQAADIFLMASKKEGLPNALLEAMAVGLPVVVNNINMLKNYLIQHKSNGLLFNKYSDIPKLLKLLKNDKALRQRIGSKATETIRMKHSYTHILGHLQI